MIDLEPVKISLNDPNAHISRDIELEILDRAITAEKAVELMAEVVAGTAEQKGGCCYDCPACGFTCTASYDDNDGFGEVDYCASKIIEWAMKEVREANATANKGLPQAHKKPITHRV